MVLVEGAGAGGVTVDQADFSPPGAAAAGQVIEAILPIRESAAESGYQLRSSGVTWTTQADAAALRNALAAWNIENVMLFPAIMAAAALAQSVGSATNCARTALLFVEPKTATLAVVDTSDGSVADVQRKPLPNRDDAALAELATMVASAESMRAGPDGVFVVGSGVDIPSIKPALEAATSLSVTAPEEPEMALARGAALASANERFGAPSTVAMPYVQDLARELAYSAEADDESDPPPGDYRDGRRSRKVLAILGATGIFVGGVVALTLALALGIRPHVDQRPNISKNVVAPATQAAPAPLAPAPASPPPAATPAPAPAAPDPGPSWNLPRQWPPLRPGDDDHDDHGDWLRRHLGRGILGS